MTGRFDGKVAIVTGGAGGIGAAIVARLAADGAEVMVADLNPPAEDGAYAFQRTDVSSAADCAAMVKTTLDRFGRLDILVNNAGIGALAETPDMADETWDRLVAVNLSAIFYTCRAAIPAMRAGGGGAIVNVASISGLAGDYGMGAYCASKAGAINYTRSLAVDCAGDGIRVNALCPGPVKDTAIGVGQFGSAADRQAWIDYVPLRRHGTPVEMANVVAFLVSDEASFMTGSIVVADGGASAHTGQPDVPAQLRRRAAERVDP